MVTQSPCPAPPHPALPTSQSPLSREGSTVKRQRFSSRWRSNSLWGTGVTARKEVLRALNPLLLPRPTRGCPCAAGSPRAALGVPAAGSPAAAPAGAATSAPEAAGGRDQRERRGPRTRSGGYPRGGSLARELGRRPQRLRGPRERRERPGRMGATEAEPKGAGPTRRWGLEGAGQTGRVQGKGALAPHGAQGRARARG